MFRSLSILVLLLLGACGKVQPCRFKVGDRIRTITGEEFVVMSVQDGQLGGVGSREPSYVVSKGTGWGVGVGKDGLHLQRGTYRFLESQIAEVVR